MVLWIRTASIASLVWTFCNLRKRKCEFLWGNGKEILQKKNGITFQYQGNSLANTLKCAWVVITLNYFGKGPALEKHGKNIFSAGAWHDETVGWQMSCYSLWCLNTSRHLLLCILPPMSHLYYSLALCYCYFPCPPVTVIRHRCTPPVRGKQSNLKSGCWAFELQLLHQLHSLG